ncbi:predicted protein [Uncinocarpus reesii 1704]|uniref:Protein kinase domain-containing protein n=1 Tax=Uncinocarpus reesii (strain UAMH 1704) TaxID=336963 RepID=C4JQ12_UNCRE|nr:uncharacterized protein UREG_03245 [Uncinocarpus reesii 1704]EEP78399.1 predicted protein [Uncinocarpus reesii 1704]
MCDCYENWAKEVGLDGQDPEEFEKRCQGNVTVINIIVDILSQLCHLVTMKDELQKKYGLQVLDKSSKPLGPAYDSNEDVPVKSTPLLWSNTVVNAERAMCLAQFQQKLGKMHKLKWAIRGQGETTTASAETCFDAPCLCSRMADFLEYSASQRNLSKKNWVSQNYAAAARFKSISLKRASDATKGAALPAAVKLDETQISTSNSQSERALATFKGQKVLIEFKLIQESDRAVFRILEDRLKDLISLLQVTPKPTNYRVLDCQGYIATSKEANKVAYGLVFSLPDALSTSPEPKLNSLHSLLRGTTDNKVPVGVPLEARFRLATLLASSLVEIHAAGWLHHNITSRNVLCLAAEGEGVLSRPYIGGFGYARFDDPSEVSEMADLGTVDNLYRHPDYQSPRAQGRKFRRSYDLYSLGIVLVEIGLWKRIEAFRRSGMSHPGAFATHIRESVAPMLEYYMGANYCDAVACCLDVRKLNVGDDEGRKLSDAVSRKVVAVLESCQI